MLTAAPELGHQLMIPTMFRIMIMLMKITSCFLMMMPILMPMTKMVMKMMMTTMM